MNKRLALVAGSGILLVASACGGGSSASGGSSNTMVVDVASNGFGKLLPHTIFVADSQGFPTTSLIEIVDEDDLFENLTADNVILPPTVWDEQAILPNGDPGNHFIYARFRQDIDVSSVLEPSAGAAFDNNLKGPIQVLEVDPVTRTTVPIEGRAFIGGRTYGFNADPDSPGDLLFEQWVEITSGANGPVVQALVPEAVGFPGTQSTNTFGGITDLVDEATFLFIPDSDDDLSTHETFPAGVQISMRMTSDVRSKSGRRLRQEALASSTVGLDAVPPEVAISGQNQEPQVIPGNGDIDIDPATSITVRFTEPIQLLSIGDLNDGTPPSVGAGIQLGFGPQTSRVTVPFGVSVPSVYDLSTVVLIPAYTFPGSPPAGVQGSCGDFSTVDVTISAGQFADLAGRENTIDASTFFVTDEAPGLVNAPVSPDTVYIGRGGSQAAISVIDLNGFGAGTGNPTYDPDQPITEGNTNYPNNPNVQQQGTAIFPPLSPGSCTFDGGSSGVFSLAKDSSLRDVVAGFPQIESVTDMALGHSLDGVFNNAAPFGCQAGGGNLCAQTAIKLLSISAGDVNTLAPSGSSAALGIIKIVSGGENLVSFAPHPNPPPLVYPPLCLSPLIGGQEPSSVDNGIATTTIGGTFGVGLEQLLKPGLLPLGNPATNTPPDGLLTPEQNTYFLGPSRPPQMGVTCSQYIMRQQIGHFLYVCDRQAGEIVVYNSNRFFVIDRIPVPDPTSLAMSPSLDLLAVSNQGSDVVSFIDVNPASGTFHQIVKTTPVGRGPTGIAWDPGNEDILVCNQLGNSLSVISALSLELRKTTINQLNAPFEVAITPRQVPGLGFSRNVYFAYILNADGSVSVFESGPDGIQGWGFDDVVGQLPFTFERPKTIVVDHRNTSSAVWIAHENKLLPNGQLSGQPGGALTNVGITSAQVGQVNLDPGSFGTPGLRDLGFGVLSSIGSDQLTGVPVDIAFDNQRNRSALTNFAAPPYSAGLPTNVNGKSIVKPNAGAFVPGNTPRFMFVAIPSSTEGPGVVDVINLDAGTLRFDTNPFEDGVQSIPAPGANVVMDYFRQ